MNSGKAVAKNATHSNPQSNDTIIGVDESWDDVVSILTELAEKHSADLQQEDPRPAAYGAR